MQNSSTRQSMLGFLRLFLDLRIFLVLVGVVYTAAFGALRMRQDTIRRIHWDGGDGSIRANI